jgi:hypothetical protein
LRFLRKSVNSCTVYSAFVNCKKCDIFGKPTAFGEKGELLKQLFEKNAMTTIFLTINACRDKEKF